MLDGTRGIGRTRRLRAGERLLVHGAASGSGLAAVDLRKLLGARVIATSTEEKRAFLPFILLVGTGV